MLPIEVFYHVYAPEDARHSQIYFYLDEQLSLINSSGLADHARVNVCLTLPTSAYQGYFVNHILMYLNGKFPFANVIDVRDTQAQNIYEGITLNKLYNRCLQEDLFVLYLHTKGSGNVTAVNIHMWRQILNHFCINHWQQAVAALSQGHELVGVKDTDCIGRNAVSGNIWWSQSSYIRTLPEPIQSDLYNKDPDRWPHGAIYRYTFEDWYWLNSPKTHWLADTQINHYADAKFIGDI